MNDGKPNIILMNCDDLGYGDLGCYGATVNSTPTLDRLAAEGVRFTDFYMASAVCSASRGAMMTGCYPSRIGFDSFDGEWVLFPGQGVGLNPAETTVATLLRQQGYATALIGKWHCGDQPEFLPTLHGFDRYYGLPYSNDMGLMRRFEEQGQRYPPLPLMRGEEIVEEQPDQASLTERYVEESVRFIRENRGKKPFFLYFAHMHVHLPLIAARRFLDRSRNGPYGATVECIDWSMAALLAELRRLGLDKNTLIVFTSDNGSKAINGGSNAPLRGTKGTTWEGGFRLPCIAWWPGRVPAGGVCREISTAMDFLPTFTRLAGGEPPADRILDGKDIRPMLFGESGAKSEYEVFYYYLRCELQAVRAGDWKLHVLSGELYNLAEDVGETRNVAARHPDVVRRLEALAQKGREDLGDSARNITGKNRRPIGRVANPKPLTEYDPNHPYIIGMYDGEVGLGGGAPFVRHAGNCWGERSGARSSQRRNGAKTLPSAQKQSRPTLASF